MLTGGVQRGVKVAGLRWREPDTKPRQKQRLHAADGERHRCLLQSVPYKRRAQPISCKCATSARNRPEIAVIQRPRGLHAPILVTSHTHTHTHTHTDSNNCNMTLDKGMSHQESSRTLVFYIFTQLHSKHSQWGT